MRQAVNMHDIDGGTVRLDIATTAQGPVAHLVIDHNRRRNAIGPAVIAALTARCAEIASRDDIRLVTLRGEGGIFAAGANVKVMAGLDPDGARAFITSLGEAIEAMRTLPVPTIAIMQGHAVGAAMELGAACDIRIADTTLVTGMPEVRVGIPSVIQASLLPRLIGWGRTSEILLTGRDISAEEALAIGYLERLTQPEDLEDAVCAWTDGILACEPAAIRAQKEVMLCWNPDAQAGIEASIDVYAATFHRRTCPRHGPFREAHAMILHRSYLFAPGNHPRKVEKVFDAGADAVILDLEDAVAASEKVATRAVVAEALSRPRPCRAYIRVNALDTGLTFGDLEAVIRPGLDGIILPKVERAADVQMVDWVMTELEKKLGLPEGGIDLMPIIETGPAVAAVRDIATAGGRMQRLSFGAGDYTRDMGMDWTRDEAECAHARAEIVLASRVAGLEPPVDTVWIELADTDGLAASTTRVKAMGFQGKLCIHPGQIAPVHAVFTPDAETVARAKKIVAAFDAAEAAGSASIQVDGYFVDYPIVEKARRTLAIASAAGTA
jgi:citrate lyase subunit beta/citryl-CoA lyase